MHTKNWAPIDQYTDASLQRMARDSRDMRSGAAARELARRGIKVSTK